MLNKRVSHLTLRLMDILLALALTELGRRHAFILHETPGNVLEIGKAAADSQILYGIVTAKQQHGKLLYPVFHYEPVNGFPRIFLEALFKYPSGNGDKIQNSIHTDVISIMFLYVVYGYFHIFFLDYILLSRLPCDDLYGRNGDVYRLFNIFRYKLVQDLCRPVASVFRIDYD